MTEQKNSPVLRFPGFDSNWSKKRLKKIADINPKSKQNRPEQFNYIDLESVKQGRIINISKVSKDNAPSRAQRIAQKQDIFFQTVRPYQQNNFIYNFDVDDVVVSTGYAQFRTINHKYYIFTLLHTYRFLVNVLLNCTGSNYPAINSTDLSNIEVYITENKLEQEKIGNFFSKLDQQIKLEEKKLELLEQQKRGYMQKLFSQELRFKDENGYGFPNWRYNYLENYIISYNEKTTENNQYPVLTSSREGLFLQKDYFTRDVASKDNTGYNVVPYGYFTYRHMSDDLIFKFNINYIVQKGIVSTLYPVFKTTNDLDNYFLKEVLNNGNEFKKYALMQKQGGSRTYMYFNKLKKLKLHIPVLEEQQKIGDFLVKLDKLIENQSKKIDFLKQRKQGLLQKMFI